MRTFNKVVTVLGLLLAFVLLPVIAAIPAEILNMLRDLMFGAETQLTTGARLLIAALAVVLWVIAVVLLWMEFRPSRPGTIRVAAVEGGVATVQSHSVERRVEQALMSLPAVQAVQARVEQNKAGVSANLTLDTDSDINVPEVTSAAIARTRYLLEKEVGAKVGGVNVRVRHVAPKARRPAPAAPAVTSVPARPAPVYTPPAAMPAVPPAEAVRPAAEAPRVSYLEPAPEPVPPYESEPADWRATDGEPEPPPAEDDGLPEDKGEPL
ncbi:MAG: Asp23/Gls24 family envelope stress response protein [Anaerolineae bacterium]